MAAITHVFTIARVAQILGEDVIAVYGPGDDDYTPAFTDFGIENLRELIEVHRKNSAPQPVAPTEPDPAP